MSRSSIEADKEASERKIPLVILSGFLGAGKTTLLNHLLRNPAGRKLAVLVNDVGEVNIDAALVRDCLSVDGGESKSVVELNNGCICCGIQNEFGKAVIELAKRTPDCIVVEATGVAEPQRIISSLASGDEKGVSALDFVRITNLVTLVDSQWWAKKMQEAYTPVRRAQLLFSDPRRPLSELLTLQVECASVIVLNKIDLVDNRLLHQSRSALATLCPEAEILTATDGQVEVEPLLGEERFDLLTAFKQSRCDFELGSSGESRSGEKPKAASGHSHGDFGLSTFTYRSRYPISHVKLVSYLREGTAGLLRAKGFAWTDREPDRIGYLSLAGDTLRFDYLGKWIHARVSCGEIDRAQIPADVWRKWDANVGDRRQEIVFIGIDLDRLAIESALETFTVESPTVG